MESPDNSSMISAIRQGSVLTVAKLIDEHGLSCEEWSGGYHLLLEALQCKHIAVAKLLLSNGAEVNAENPNIFDPSPLHVAVENNEKEIVEILLQKGTGINVIGSKRLCTPLHVAVLGNNIEITELLLKHKAFVDISNGDEETPLRTAVERGFVDILKILIERGANVNLANPDSGSTPLHVACGKGSKDIVELLLDGGAEVNAGTWDSCTPLHVSVEKGFKEIVEVLVNRGADIDAQSAHFYSPLRIGVKEEHKDVDLLLKVGARVDVKTARSLTPLDLAVQKGDIDIIAMLLNSGANINAKVDDFYKSLHTAIRNRRIDIVELLLRHGANANGEVDCCTPLHIAVQDNSTDVNKFADLLLNNGADVNAKTKDSNTPLHIAIKNNRSVLVQLLLERGADVDSEDKDSNTPLCLAVKNGCLIILDHVLKFRPDVDNKSNQDAVSIAAIPMNISNAKEIIKRLLEYGFLIKPEDATNGNITSCVIIYGFLKIADEIFKNGASSMHLSLAAVYNNLEMAKVLLKHGANVNGIGILDKTPIYDATMNGDFNMFQLFLANGAVLKDPGELLWLAARAGCFEIVKTLLERGCDVNFQGENNRTALHETTYFCAARANAHVQIAEYLLLNGANVDARDVNGDTPLLIAAGQRSNGIVEILLKHGADINAVDEFGETVIHNSVQSKCLTLTRLLLNNNAKIISGHGGRTPLHTATCSDDVEHVKILLEYGADVNAVSIDVMDATALHTATRRGQFSLVKILLEYGADVNLQSCQGIALHVIPMYMHEHIVEILLEYGSDVNIINREDATPVEWACLNTGYSSKSSFHFLVLHVVKMTAAGLYVSKRNLRFLQNESRLECAHWRSTLPEEVVTLMSRCHEEIEFMKKTKIADSFCTYYDILTRSARRIVRLLGNDTLVQTLNEGDYRDVFPVYASMISSRFELAKRRRQLEEESKRVFFVDCVPGLPDICMDRIIRYLTNGHLMMLIRICCRANCPSQKLDKK